MFEELIRRTDAANARVGTAQLELLRLIADVDRCGAWEDDGARDVAHWLGMRYGISEWKARRWVVAAHALDGLRRLSRALADGTLGIDKVVELTRFATPENESRLIAWASKSRAAPCADAAMWRPGERWRTSRRWSVNAR